MCPLPEGSPTNVVGVSENANGLPPANWYPDPRDPTQQRYWDGQSWTVQTRPVEAQAHQPSVADPAATAVVSQEPSQPSVTTPGLAPEAQQSGGATSASPVGGQVGGEQTATSVTSPTVDEAAAAVQAAEAANFAVAAEAALAGAAATASAAQASMAESVNAEAATAVLSTTSQLPGHRVTGVLGVVCGIAVRPMGTASDREALSAVRQDALHQLQLEAVARGATAVVAVQFDTVMNPDGSAELAAYGTAVITEAA